MRPVATAFAALTERSKQTSLFPSTVDTETPFTPLALLTLALPSPSRLTRAKATALPGSPLSPLSPLSPFGPCEPCEPVAPVAPVAPVSPFGPWAPVAPVAPVSPLSPLSPFGPAGPAAPVGPRSPLIPDAPVSPFGPGGPAGPCGPCAPAGPRGPTLSTATEMSLIIRAGRTPFLFRSGMAFGLAVEETECPSSFPAFFANIATRTTLLAASPSGVKPSTATASAVIESTSGRRLRMNFVPSLRALLCRPANCLNVPLPAAEFQHWDGRKIRRSTYRTTENYGSALSALHR